MIEHYSLDTNILIYLYDNSSSFKREISENLIYQKPIISTQVISEFLNVTKRLLKLPKEELL